MAFVLLKYYRICRNVRFTENTNSRQNISDPINCYLSVTWLSKTQPCHTSCPFAFKYTKGLQITTGNGFVCHFLLWQYKYTFYLDFWLCACALSTLTTIFCSSIKKARLILRIKAEREFRQNVSALQLSVIIDLFLLHSIINQLNVHVTCE